MTRLLALSGLLFLAVTPALAQESICGGISLVGEWAGGAEDASDVATADAPFEMEGQVPIAGHLVRMFTLSAPAEIRIDVDALPAGDPYIAVYDAEGAEVAADDDSGSNFGSRVQTMLGAGTYCLAARSYDSGVTDVAAVIGRADHEFGPDPVPASPPATAPVTGSGAGCFGAGTARLADDLDAAGLEAQPSATATTAGVPAYDFTLAEAHPLSIIATSQAGDPLIRLVGGDGQILNENDDYDGLNARIDMADPVPAGEYCVEVEDLNGAGNDVTVTLAPFDPADDRARRLDMAEFAPTADDDVAITDLGTLDATLLHEVRASGAAQWFRVHLPEGGLLLVEAIGDGADPVVTLFDRVGRQIGMNDDGPDGLDSFLAMRLLPGDYTLALRLVDGNARAPVRLLMERYVPAR
ncbi:hypothetical protein MWU52_00270 [Jannaschia sp. S6380]|uniref:hypothetical protein n=1 Tax=Jannaschia sp. S6380 TaxID=2926408 RepID=UPI001FF38612|nr:hypothetical protein [Jannaschia sp. S6380]MCK0165975.1 hypothetical protein [Jannaschia sp. S6380]